MHILSQASKDSCGFMRSAGAGLFILPLPMNLKCQIQIEKVREEESGKNKSSYDMHERLHAPATIIYSKGGVRHKYASVLAIFLEAKYPAV